MWISGNLATAPAACHENPTSEDGLVQMEVREEVGPDELAISELSKDASGRLVGSRRDEPFSFRKETGNPLEGVELT